MISPARPTHTSSRTQHCSRGVYFAERLKTGVEDPYHVIATNYVMDGVCSSQQLQALAQWLPSTFDAFRTGLAWAGDVMQAVYVETEAPWEFIECDDVASVLADEKQFCRENRHRIDLLRGKTLVVLHYVDHQTGRSLLRLLHSHFASDAGSRRILDSAMRDLRTGKALSITPESYLDWMDVCWRYAVSPRAKTEVEFWEKVEAQHYNGMQRLGARLAGAHRHHSQLEVAPETILCLARLCRHTLADTFLAIVCLALTEIYELSCVGISWTGHGRHAVAGEPFLHTVGWLSDLHPIVVECTRRGAREMVGTARKALLSLPNGGSTFNWLANFGRDGGPCAFRELLRSPVRINYRQNGLPFRDSDGTACPTLGEPTITTVSKPDVSFGPLDVYLTIDVGSVSKVSLVLSGNVAAGHANEILGAIHRQIGAFTALEGH